MKKWNVRIKGTTNVEVIADTYEEAISKINNEINSQNNLKWKDYEIDNKSIEVTNEED